MAAVQILYGSHLAFLIKYDACALSRKYISLKGIFAVPYQVHSLLLLTVNFSLSYTRDRHFELLERRSGRRVHGML